MSIRVEAVDRENWKRLGLGDPGAKRTRERPLIVGEAQQLARLLDVADITEVCDVAEQKVVVLLGHYDDVWFEMNDRIIIGMPHPWRNEGLCRSILKWAVLRARANGT